MAINLRKPQISGLCGNFSPTCGLMCPYKDFADLNILRSIYFCPFHSRLHCSIIGWGRAYPTAIQPVQVLQNRIWKYMTFTSGRSCVNGNFKQLKVVKVCDLYQFHLANFMCKFNASSFPF